MTLSRKAEAAITAANLLCKAGVAANSCDVCGADDTPIGVSARVCRSGELATLLALEDGVFQLVAAGSVTFGDIVEIASGGKVKTLSSGTAIGKALESAVDGQSFSVSVAASVIYELSSFKAAVTISPSGGDFTGSQEITLSAPDGCLIRYTTDGSTPTATSGTLYESPFSFESSCTVKAIAIKAGDVKSEEFTKVALDTPSGFTWGSNTLGELPTITITEPTEGVFAHDLDMDDYRITPDATRYISPSGSDSNDGLTDSTPMLTAQAAVNDAQAAGKVKIRIYAAAGTYPGGCIIDRPSDADSGHYDLELIAVGGRAVWTTGTFGNDSSVVQDGANPVWKIPTHVAVAVYDRSNRGATYGEPEVLSNAASLAACRTTASSWFSDGTDTYIHTFDGRQIDADIVTTIAPGANTTACLSMRGGLYAYKCDFYGGYYVICSYIYSSKYPVSAGDPFRRRPVLSDDCEVVGSRTGGNWYHYAWHFIWHRNLRSYHSNGDGLSYTAGVLAGSTLSPGVIEENVTSYMHGVGTSDQCTSIHTNFVSIILNGDYAKAKNGILTNGAGTTQMWVLGAHIGLAKTPSISQVVQITAGDFWLDSCVFDAGATYQLDAQAAGVVMRHRNCTGITSVREQSGGIVATY